jgi:hypothetical protein
MLDFWYSISRLLGGNFTIHLDVLDVRVRLKRSYGIIVEGSTICNKVSYHPLEDRRIILCIVRSGRGDSREALDQAVFMTDLSTLIDDMLLGAK